MKVVFLPNFSVKNAHLIYPAANLSNRSRPRARRPPAPAT